MATSVTVYTYAHSVSYVTDKMLNSIKTMIMGIGLDPSKFTNTNNWLVYERGVKTWLETKHLKEAVLEITSSTGAFVTRCDFIIDYNYNNGEGAMWLDIDGLKFAIAKLGFVAKECDYEFKLILGAGAPSVDGWYDCELLSTAGFVKQSLGTAIGTNSIGAQAAYWRKVS
jgi:hypothetical protein